MFGRPTPTKQTRWPASSRAAATIIISDFVNSLMAVHRRRRGRHGPPRGPTVDWVRGGAPNVPPGPIDGPAHGPSLGCRVCGGSCVAFRTTLAPGSGPPSSRRTSPVLSVVDGAGRRGGGRAERSDPLLAELLDVLRATVDPPDPLVEPRLSRGLIARDRIPVEVEPVVAVVCALDVGRMRAPWLDHDRVDDQAGDDRPVRIGADDRLVDDFFNHDDDPIRGKGCLLLATEQTPDLCVAGGGRPLRVDDGHCGPQRRDRVDDAVAVGRLD